VTDERGLSLNEIRARIAQFVVDYKDATSERQDAQNFWRDLMHCYGVDSVRRRGVLFEHPAIRSDTGREGFIDVFLPGKFLAEHKSAGKITVKRGESKSNAEKQAEAYLTGGSITRNQLPRYVLTSDFVTVQVTDLDRPKIDPLRTKTIRVEDLPENLEALLFLTGRDDVDAIIREDQADASIAAASVMGELFTALTSDSDTEVTPNQDTDADKETYDASILLTRLLFLMFGDDAGLWGRGLFHRFILERTAPDGSDLGAQLSTLFEVLDTPEDKRDRRMDESFAQFPYVNGALFERGAMTMPWFDSAMREAMLKACQFDWSRISPAVFGSLFQTVHDKKARHAGGEHYTSEENILKTLRPLFLDDLRKRLDAANTKPALEALHDELANLRYVDPACGCGNFLIVAYREMRQLELDLLVKLRTKQGKSRELIMDANSLLKVSLEHFSGIEIKWWPAKIAETAMFLVDHQANRQMERVLGVTPTRLPINVSANIHHANALTSDWNDLLPAAGPRIYVFGNPPFLGRHKRNREQAAELAAAWDVKNAGHRDYVTAWHATAAKYLSDKEGEFAFVATNSITQGEPVSLVFPWLFDRGWKIRFAHRTFKWDSETAAKEKAAVHCVVIGFTRDASVRERLFDYSAPDSTAVEVPVKVGINAYLVDGRNVVIPKRVGSPLSPSLPPIGYGSMPNDGGALIIESDDINAFMVDPVAAKYVRPYVGADELINGTERWCLWLIGLEPADISKSTLLRTRIEASRQARIDSRNPETNAKAATPHLFWFINQPDVPYLCIPQVFSEHRPWATAARLDKDAISNNRVYTCPDPDGFAFGIVSSSMFITWQKTVGGRLESRPNFSSHIVWNNLPLPEVSSEVRAAVIAAGKGVLAERAKHPDRTLAEHYHPLAMDQGLVRAHQELDWAVDEAFGAGRGRMTHSARQTVLFDRFAEMSGLLV
jgi:hypothetical protein